MGPATVHEVPPSVDRISPIPGETEPPSESAPVPARRTFESTGEIATALRGVAASHGASVCQTCPPSVERQRPPAGVPTTRCRGSRGSAASAETLPPTELGPSSSQPGSCARAAGKTTNRPASASRRQGSVWSISEMLSHLVRPARRAGPRRGAVPPRPVPTCGEERPRSCEPAPARRRGSGSRLAGSRPRGGFQPGMAMASVRSPRRRSGSSS